MIVPTVRASKPKRPPTQDELEHLWNLMVQHNRQNFRQSPESCEAYRLTRGRLKVGEQIDC